MQNTKTISQLDIQKYLKDFYFNNQQDLFTTCSSKKTRIEYVEIDNKRFPKFINEFWTPKQRQSAPLHEISYRACFKANLPRFFINLLTSEGDIVYDPFAGRGTTAIEAGLLRRNVISNDINPLSKILSFPRFFIPKIKEVERRLSEIIFDKDAVSKDNLLMFYHPETLGEIVSLKKYLLKRKNEKKEDFLDKWIRMVATNRLTGHSAGFFSVYTLPPNQALSRERQIKINEQREQVPLYRDVKSIILKKSKSLVTGLTELQIKNLFEAGKNGLFLTEDARNTKEIPNESVKLTVTSPPFLDVVPYAQDNWLRCWFNLIGEKEITKKITVSKKIEMWSNVMEKVFRELYRITKSEGWIAFEVGEIRGGTIRLDEYIVPLGINAGFECRGVLINEQIFTKTANIWGVDNNKKGTNSNRVVLFCKTNN